MTKPRGKSLQEIMYTFLEDYLESLGNQRNHLQKLSDF